MGSDASTYISVFSVGPDNDFPDGVTGVAGDGVADITRLIITADPSNPFGSNFNSIFMANARFTGSTGIVGISAVNINVQGAVQIGDINASDSGVPTLLFGAASQFGTVQVSGGSLEQDNGIPINDGGFTSVNFVNSTDSDGDSTLGSVFAGAFRTVEDGGPAIPTVTLIDEDQTFDLTSKTQGQIDDFFLGRNFLGNVTVIGDLIDPYTIEAESFRGDLTFTGDVFGSLVKADIIVNGNIDGTLTFLGDVDSRTKITVEGEVNDVVVGTSENSANFDGELKANNIGLGTETVTIWGDFGGFLTTDADDSGEYTEDSDEGKIGNINVHGNFSGNVEGVLGIGNVWVGGNLTTSDGDAFETDGGPNRYADIGNITIEGDVLQTSGDFLSIDENGNFGDIVIMGGGGGRIRVENIHVHGDVAPGIGTTGSITITSTGVDLDDGGENEGEIWIEDIDISGNGNLGDITVTGSGTDNSRIYLDEDIEAAGGEDEIGSIGNITFTSANHIEIGGSGNIQGDSVGNITFETKNGLTDPSTILIGRGIVARSGNIGNIILDAGNDTGSTVIIDRDIEAELDDDGNFGNIGTITFIADEIIFDK